MQVHIDVNMCHTVHECYIKSIKNIEYFVVTIFIHCVSCWGCFIFVSERILCSFSLFSNTFMVVLTSSTIWLVLVWLCFINRSWTRISRRYKGWELLYGWLISFSFLHSLKIPACYISSVFISICSPLTSVDSKHSSIIIESMSC